MHLSNFSHWVCVFSGLLLIITSMFSRITRRVIRTSGSTTAEAYSTETAKRLFMVAIGVAAVAYGVSRLVA